MILTKEIRGLVRNGSAKQRMIGLLCGLVFCAASSPDAKAAQIYHCEYEFLSKTDKGLSGEAKVEISGDVLKLFVKTFPHRLGGVVTSHTESRYKIIKQNKVGIVAVQPHAYHDKDVGPLAGAKILTIRLSDGALREGTVEVGGVYDLLKGHCK